MLRLRSFEASGFPGVGGLRFSGVPMLKSDLINILVVKRGVTQKQAEATIETIFDSMKTALCKGENIEIRGLGAFHVKHYDGYQGRNPKTGEVIPVKPKRGILFRTGKELRDRVNRPEDSPPTDSEGQGTPPVAAGA
jgi:integration host factor subunit beta